MPYRDKYLVRDALSAVNWKLRGQGKRMLLLTPGRICTSSPELGVPSAFSDISEFDMIAEISESRAGYVPELSYGSHIFQDLVEAEILYTAVFESETTVHFSPGLLEAFPDCTQTFLTGEKDMIDMTGEAAATDGGGALSEIIHVYDVHGSGLTLYYDMSDEHLMVGVNDPE